MPRKRAQLWRVGERGYITGMDEREQLRASAVIAVHRAIRAGRLDHPSWLPCVECGRAAQEYDHYMGYAREHFLTVQPICRSCHRRRTTQTIRARPKVYWLCCRFCDEKAIASGRAAYDEVWDRSRHLRRRPRRTA